MSARFSFLLFVLCLLAATPVRADPAGPLGEEARITPQLLAEAGPRRSISPDPMWTGDGVGETDDVLTAPIVSPDVASSGTGGRGAAGAPRPRAAHYHNQIRAPPESTA